MGDKSWHYFVSFIALMCTAHVVVAAPTVVVK